jgi:hypothetical protein
MRRTLLTICCLALLTALETPAAATAQVPDELSYKGKKHALFSTPLEGYFDQGGKRPKGMRSTSTACWRGYAAVWEIKRSYLQLRRMHECHDPKKVITLPGKKLPLRATWFTGVLRVPLGKQLQYVHMGFASTYEKDLLLWLQKGKLVAQRTIDNRPGKRTQASKPRPAKQIARGLAAARAMINRSCLSAARAAAKTKKPAAAAKMPDAVLLKFRVTAHGTPRNIQIVDRLPVTIASCVEAAVMVLARFPPSDGEVDVQHWLKLR